MGPGHRQGPANEFIVIYVTPKCPNCRALRESLMQQEPSWPPEWRSRVLLQDIESQRSMAMSILGLHSVPTLRLFQGKSPKYVKEAVGPAAPVKVITRWLSGDHASKT